MDSDSLRDYNFAQVQEMMVYWESRQEELHRKIDENQACCEWIQLYASKFEAEWVRTHSCSAD